MADNNLDTKSMTYGGVMVAVILSAIAGGVLIFTDTEGTTYYLSEDGATETWGCNEPAMKSDCINGIKAEGKRCYYDPFNGRKYKNCNDLWFEIELPIEEIPEDEETINSGVWGNSYKVKEGLEPVVIS